jgi:hypothetical protein
MLGAYRYSYAREAVSDLHITATQRAQSRRIASV